MKRRTSREMTIDNMLDKLTKTFSMDRKYCAELLSTEAFHEIAKIIIYYKLAVNFIPHIQAGLIEISKKHFDNEFICVFRRIRTPIPAHSGHQFQPIPDTNSSPFRTPIPIENGHLFQSKADTHSRAKRTPPNRSEATLENL